jgi:hypothetical protein
MFKRYNIRLGCGVRHGVRRPYGIRYALTLHDRANKRIMGFDNAHSVQYARKNKVAPKRSFDHWHSNINDDGQPYTYTNAGKLMEDFWKEVEKILKKLEESKK